MLLIYVENISARCKYVFDFVFKGNEINYQLTDDEQFFLDSEQKRLNYSTRHFSEIEKITSSQLLFDDEIKEYQIELDNYLEEACFSFNKTTDPLASIFFVLTRMEEYLITEKRDIHYRFNAGDSIQYKHKLIDKLVCDRWSKQVIDLLYKKGLIEYNFKPKKLTIHPTFDIDNAYAYLLKSGKRRLLSTLKDITRINTGRLIERKKVLSGKSNDPYNTYNYILKIAEKQPVNVFWLLGNYSKYDRNIDFNNKEHQQLIRKVNESCTVGIHPSYFSNSNLHQLKTEIDRLSRILEKPIKNSRQHFLKLNLPSTYQNLISVGITDDYTMGYAAEIGFRAGTLRPFLWFDLSKNELTNLTIHPFAYMDGTLLEYKNWSISNAKEHILKLYEEAKQFGGDFYFLWHNETIGNYGKWKGWQEVLEFTLNLENHKK